MPRTCGREGCTKPLPPGSATQRRYCSGRCQRAESRRLAVNAPILAENGDHYTEAGLLCHTGQRAQSYYVDARRFDEAVDAVALALDAAISDFVEVRVSDNGFEADPREAARIAVEALIAVGWRP